MWQHSTMTLTSMSYKVVFPAMLWPRENQSSFWGFWNIKTRKGDITLFHSYKNVDIEELLCKPLVCGRKLQEAYFNHCYKQMKNIRCPACTYTSSSCFVIFRNSASDNAMTLDSKCRETKQRKGKTASCGEPCMHSFSIIRDKFCSCVIYQVARLPGWEEQPAQLPGLQASFHSLFMQEK